ncbi:MAG TPA: hypothetical protein VF251_02130, partial [Pyrinomonadaceae bacterium]
TRLDAQRRETPVTLWGLNGSASLKDKQLTLTVVNPHHNQTRETEIAIRGASVMSGTTRTLASNDIHMRNSFANPHALEPKDGTLQAKGSSFVYQFAPGRSRGSCLP